MTSTFPIRAAAPYHPGLTPPSQDLSTARQELLAWYDVHRRDLPWRRTSDVYAIWVSEVMLQQTQVDRVVRYWGPFLEAFPTVEALARASLPQVLSRWSGLGYYGRARNLHRAAQAVAAAGRFPDTLEGLKALPGFGRYTAGAVASIALGLPAPLVDGNVGRVFARAFEVEGPPGDRAREAALWALAEALVPGPRPGDWNQALMELGATVCLPVNPTCLLCPWRTRCRALASGRVSELPPPRKQASRKRLALAVAVVRDEEGRWLLARRPAGGLFGGLWELPAVEVGHEATLRTHGLTLKPRAAVVERTLTHRELSLHLHPASLDGTKGSPPPPYVEWGFHAPDGLGRSSATDAALAVASTWTGGTLPRPPRPALQARRPRRQR